MLADDCLHGLGTCHGRLPAHERRDRAEAEPSDFGDLPECGWANVVLHAQEVHHRKVLFLLVPHFLQ